MSIKFGGVERSLSDTGRSGLMERGNRCHELLERQAWVESSLSIVESYSLIVGMDW